MSAQLALQLPDAPTRPELREVPRPALVLPRALRVALATVPSWTRDGKLFQELAGLYEVHGAARAEWMLARADGITVVRRELRTKARRLGLVPEGGR